jgi:hypothetical protein
MASAESNIAGRTRGTARMRAASPRHVIDDAWRYPILVKVIQVLSAKPGNRTVSPDLPNTFGITNSRMR